MIALAFLLAAAAPQSAKAPSGPGEFVTGLYAQYRNEDFGSLGKPERVFAPELVAAIRTDQRLAGPEEVGLMDYDPICQCQDSHGMKAKILGIVQPNPASAEARIALTFSGAYHRTLTLKLARTPAGWRVRDVATKEQPSLLGSLQRENTRAQGKR